MTAKRVFTNPFFHFGFLSFVLLGLLFFSSPSLAQLNNFKGGNTVFLNATNNGNGFFDINDLFLDQHDFSGRETPDLKLSGDNVVYGISTPNVTTTQTLGALFGGEAIENRTEIIDHSVEAGDTIAALAKKYGVTEETIRSANGLSKTSQLTIGEILAVPPANGVLYVVKSGDTLGGIASRYASNTEKIVAFNGLKDENDIFIEDLLFLPDGKVPQKAAPLIVTAPVADTFFINPTEGEISQQGHGYPYKGVDVANKCGTPVYAAAAGVVQRAQFNRRYGNFVIIAHSGNISTIFTYSGHLQTLEVKPGETVGVGQRIGLMGKTGTAATGCHLHFEVRGAKNFLTALPLHAPVTFK